MIIDAISIFTFDKNISISFQYHISSSTTCITDKHFEKKTDLLTLMKYMCITCPRVFPTGPRKTGETAPGQDELKPWTFSLKIPVICPNFHNIRLSRPVLSLPSNLLPAVPWQHLDGIIQFILCWCPHRWNYPIHLCSNVHLNVEQWLASWET